MRGRSAEWLILAILSVMAVTTPLAGQKTDKIEMRNGDIVTGEIVRLDEGRVEFKTDAMRTVRVQWEKVVTIETDKVFEVVLADRTILVGSVGRAEGEQVIVREESGNRRQVATRSVVRMLRLRDDLWAAIEGDLTAGATYYQQDDRYDVTVGFELEYIGRGFGRNLSRVNVTLVDVETGLTYQDQADDRVRATGKLAHFREFGGGWIYLGSITGERNSQLSLDYRTGIGGGVGRIMLETYRAGLAFWIAPSYAVERFENEVASSTFPLEISGQLGIYDWDPLDTDVSLLATLLPILGGGGRFRFNVTLDASHEVVNDFSLVLGIREAYDSEPTSVDANRNDLVLNLGFGWSF